MKTLTQQKTEKRLRLKAKIRSKIFGTATLPRLSVFRSNSHIYAQIINDEKGITIASASDLSVGKKKITGTKKDHATEVGKAVAVAAIAAGIKEVIFDRNGFKYTGRVQLLADAARGAGLKF